RSLAALMVGRDVEVVRRRVHPPPEGRPALEIESLWVDGDRGSPAVRGVSLTVGAGEIVAVAGVAGNGQRELAEATAGLPRGAGGGDGRPAAGGGLARGGRPSAEGRRRPRGVRAERRLHPRGPPRHRRLAQPAGLHEPRAALLPAGDLRALPPAPADARPR